MNKIYSKLKYSSGYLVIVLLYLLFNINETSAQCTNADFSSNNFTNWTGSTGNVGSAGDYSSVVNGLVIGTPNSAPSTNGRHTIMNQPGTDPNTGNVLSVLPPNGTNSIRLGNEVVSECAGGNSQAEQIQYTYNVTSSNCIFTYQYAVVLQDPADANHDTDEVPKFRIYVLNSSGQVIDPVCGKYEVYASSGLPGYVTSSASSTACENNNVRWKNWTVVSMDLHQYENQSITIQFTTYDCSLGGHFGYAYISCYCGSLSLTQQCSGTSDIVTAPAGFTTYAWTYRGLL